MRKITRRSLLTAAVACGAATALSACGGSSSASFAAASSTVASASVAAAANGEKFTVGICQLVQHAALDAATQGFEDALTASFGENVTSTSRMHRAIPLPAPPLPTALFPPVWH